MPFLSQQENPAVLRKQQEQQQQQQSLSKVGTPVKTASKPSTPLRFPLIFKKPKEGVEEVEGGASPGKENKVALEDSAAEETSTTTSPKAEKYVAETKNAVEAKQQIDIKNKTENEGDAEKGGEETKTNGVNGAADGATDGVDGAKSDDGQMSSSSSTSSFINLVDFYRVFSLSALYVAVSGLFFIWLLITIFKKSDVSQVCVVNEKVYLVVSTMVCPLHILSSFHSRARNFIPYFVFLLVCWSIGHTFSACLQSVASLLLSICSKDLKYGRCIPAQPDK